MSKIISYFKQTNPSFLEPIQGIKDMPDDWREIPIDSSSPLYSDPLVPLGMFQDNFRILTNSIYFGERTDSPYKNDELEGALLTCFVRQSVAEKLEAASSLLPAGYALMVFDAYRPKTVQDSLYTDYFEQWVSLGLSEEEAQAKALEFVNMASDHPEHPSPHLTGGSVDLTIIEIDDRYINEWESLIDHIAQLQSELKELKANPEADPTEIHSKDLEAFVPEMRRQEIIRKHSRYIDVGAEFDEATEKSAVTYLDDKIVNGEQLTPYDEICMLHRRILQNLMQSVGFSSFKHEWWHIDANEGNQFNAAMTGAKNAVFGPAQLSDENLEWENIRRQHYKNMNLRIENSRGCQTKLGQNDAFPKHPLVIDVPPTEVQKAVLKAVKFGSLTESGSSMACRLLAQVPIETTSHDFTL